MRFWSDPPAAAPPPRAWRRLFAAAFLAGAALRCLCASLTVDVIHPDEHQQYLEQARRIVSGYGMLFWEQDRGVRHPLYSHLLAGPLALMESVGVADPLVQVAVLRSLVAVAVWAASAWFAWAWFVRGRRVAALLWLAFAGLTPAFVYTHSHSLTETACQAPLLAALVLLDRRPFAAGVLLGVAFGIRFQVGFVILPLYVLTWCDGLFSRAWLRFAAGGLTALAVLGGIDKLAFGDWFHSPIQYVLANLVDGTAEACGVAPWHAYVTWATGGGRWDALALLAVLIVPGAVREWRATALFAAFVVGHSLIAHKEGRFLLPVAPLGLMLPCRTLAGVVAKLPQSASVPAAVVGLAGLVAAVVLLAPAIEWNQDPYRVTAILLTEAGRRPDVTGVLVVGTNDCQSANYFYLRRDVPLHAVEAEKWGEALGWEPWTAGRVSHVVCVDSEACRFPRAGVLTLRPRLVAIARRLDGDPAVKPLLLSAVAFALSADAVAGKDELPLDKLEFADDGKKLPYRLMKPEKVEAGKAYPLVIFLHGAGERGTDNDKQLVHGVPQFATKENRAKYPCYLIAPQCPDGQKWVEVDWSADTQTMPKEPSEPMGLLIKLIEKTLKELPIDAKRVYVTGLSMGGYGTWDLVARKPDWFAAAAPVCGGGDEATAATIKDVPIWVFHGAKDGVVKPARSRNMVAALKKAGAEPKYTEYDAVGHDSWNPTYKDAAFYEWLFAQKKK